MSNEAVHARHPCADRLTTVTDAAGNVTTYGYDTENNLLSITDANSHATNFTYDAFGRVTQTTFPSSAYETYAYDAIGNLTSKTDRKGQTIQNVYDALNRLTQKNYPDSSSAAYVYDLVGKIQQVTDPTGTYAFAYDTSTGSVQALRLAQCRQHGAVEFRSVRQHFLEKGQRARIVGLSEPEHGLLAHGGILVGARNFNQLGNAFVLWHLAQREDRLLLYISVRIIFDGFRNRPRGALPGLLSQPEKRLAAHTRALVFLGHANQLVERILLAALRQRKGHLFANLWAGVALGHALQHVQPLASPRISQPKRGLGAQRFRLVERDKGREGAVRGSVLGHGNGAHGAIHRLAAFASVGFRRQGNSCKYRDAIGRAHTRKPDHAHPAGIHLAVFGQ